jgi:hypothetical protein
VKRLREGNNWDWEMMNMGGEAADRIEALEKALDDIIIYSDDDTAIKIARAALEGKNEK